MRTYVEVDEFYLIRFLVDYRYASYIHDRWIGGSQVADDDEHCPRELRATITTMKASNWHSLYKIN